MIYCEPVSDEALGSELQGADKVLMLGCSLCANISYCIANNMETPVYSGLGGAVNTKREIKRLRTLLADQGIRSSSMVLLSLCFLTNGNRRRIARKSAGYPVMLTLSCESGKKNIEEVLPGKRVVSTMKSRGFMRSLVDARGLTYEIEKDHLYINNA